jgi:hypothetical protein
LNHRKTKELSIYNFIPLNLSEFVTTLTKLNAVAPGANIALRLPIAAGGMPILCKCFRLTLETLKGT